MEKVKKKLADALQEKEVIINQCVPKGILKVIRGTRTAHKYSLFLSTFAFDVLWNLSAAVFVTWKASGLRRQLRFVHSDLSESAACNQVLIISAARRAFLRPLEEL